MGSCHGRQDRHKKTQEIVCACSCNTGQVHRKVDDTGIQEKGNVLDEGDGMDNMDRAVDAFIAAILVSEEYRCYAVMRDRVKQDPGLKEQIDDYRRRNYEFQTSTDGDFENLDRFEKEYENFRENPLVMDFLAAELDFYRMMQRINMHIVSRLQFE